MAKNELKCEDRQALFMLITICIFNSKIIISHDINLPGTHTYISM